MNPTSTLDNPTAAQRLAQALDAGRLDEADEVLGSFAAELPTQAMLPAAHLHMRRRRFAQAAALFDRIPGLDIHGRLKRNAARNFAALARHRPDAYQELIQAPINTRYQLAPVAGNRLTIADCQNPARPMLLTPGGDPVLAVQHAFEKLQHRMKDGSALGLVGIGDGFLLGTLARITPKLYMDMQVCVHLLEPDFALLNTCLMLHDYSGPHGPIEQKRFQWHIGPHFREHYLAALRGDNLLPAPGVIVQQSFDRASITPVIEEFTATQDARDERMRIEIDAYYAKFDAGHLAARLTATATPTSGGSGAQVRPPRVLLLTSRYTTVLQYATRGVAEGFQAGGWETKILIEPTTHHQITRVSMRQALAEFKPDLVFQIDHLRHEQEDLFPANLPFVCWIQDHLPHLTDVKAAATIGPRDYVLTFAAPMFVDIYQYPASQCIDMPMMLTTPRRSPPARVDGAPDLVYVSNVSQDPRTLEPGLLARIQPPHHEPARAAIRQIIARYDEGRSLASHHEVRVLLDEVSRRGRQALPGAESVRNIVEILWNPLNIALYRQQALGWVARAADDLGLSLGLYGRGWESHPLFARHARGVIENGEPLAQLTRSARINLNLEPYACFTHQRLLDGLVAGGFYLIRRHPGNTLLQELLNLLEEHFDATVQTSAAARAAAPPALRKPLDDLLRRAACLTFEDHADPVRQVRCWQRAGVLIPQPAALPHLDDVSFDDAASCRVMIERHMTDATCRESIAQAQRAGIEGRLSFAAGMKMVVARIVDSLKNERKSTVITANSQAPARPEAA